MKSFVRREDSNFQGVEIKILEENASSSVTFFTLFFHLVVDFCSLVVTLICKR